MWIFDRSSSDRAGVASAAKAVTQLATARAIPAIGVLALLVWGVVALAAVAVRAVFF